MRVLFLPSENPMANYASLWISGKSTPWLQMIIWTITIQSALCQTQHNTWQGSHYAASLAAPKLITAGKWRTNVRWRCLNSILLAERLPIKDLHKAPAYLCLPLRASCASTWTQLLKLTIVLNTWMTSESQPVMLRILPGTFGSFPVHLQCRIKTDDRKVLLWSQASWIPRQNHFIWGSITTNSQDSKNS